VPARFPASVRKRYEQLERFPKGYLVFGDAVCSFNPTYGQGMSVAALEAVALQACLDHGSGDLARRFFQKTSEVIDMPWSLVVGGDLRFSDVEGKRRPMKQFVNWYMNKFHFAAHCDPELASAFNYVIGLKASVKSLLRPCIARRVLVGNVKHRPALMFLISNLRVKNTLRREQM
jgi:2-polyprenyl-6-methoxyphenol hydroxylase-like FAD-dependent oxidoreductase